MVLISKRAEFTLGVGGIDQGAAKSLVSRNQNSPVLPAFPLCSAVALASPEDISIAKRRMQSVGCPGDNCEPQGASDRKGILYLSVPGYSNNAELAVVEVSYLCGSVCGWSGLMVFRRANGEWIFDSFITRSVS